MISRALIKKWIRMLKKESVFHLEQGKGKNFSVNDVKGYYNDLRQKVLCWELYDNDGIPYNIASKGEEKKKIYFPISIIQYGLGAYDLWLETNKNEYRDKAMHMSDWLLNNQEIDGSWDTFGMLDYSGKVSAMAQGEAASLLARAYVETQDEKYKKACEKAVTFMLKSVKDGGTALYRDNALILLEYIDKSIVLNGWMFAGFGLLDYWKISNDPIARDAWDQCVKSIGASLQNFDTGYWTLYDSDKKYTSPFYHRLHIELLKAYYELSGEIVFKEYIQKWSSYENRFIGPKRAFLVKAFQKLFEKKSKEWTLVR